MDNEGIILNSKQEEAFNYVKEGYNTFITGCAGVGKSLIISKIKEWSIKKGKKVAVTATTGVAAANVGGGTIHSWASLRLGKGEACKFAFYIKKNESNYKRYFDTDILIIDEMSMGDFEYFTMFNQVAQIVRNNRNKPFGGIQLVLCGDFFQLGPIQKDRKEMRYIFEDLIWNDMVSKSVHLTEVYRQKNSDFIDMLNNVRVGDINDEIVSKIKSTEQHKLINENGIRPTILFCRNVDVDAVNLTGLEQLETKEHEFKSITYFENDEYKTLYEKSFTLSEELILKEGAQVMLIQNLDVPAGLVNGSRGIVSKIYEKDDPEYPTGGVRVQFANGVLKTLMPFKQIFKNDNDTTECPERAYRVQYPLKLAYALTIHKSQGLSIDFLEIDMKGCFAAGQAYVALSRATSFVNLRVKNFTKQCVITSPMVKRFYKQLENGGQKRKVEGQMFTDIVNKKQKC